MKRFTQILRIVVFAIIFAPIFAGAQDENVRGAVRTSAGLLIVWNEPNNNFTIEVRGKNFERVPNKNLAFLVDEKFLQIVTAFKRDFLSEEQKQQNLNEKTILSAHFSWESGYLEKTVGEKLECKSDFITVSKTKDALIWSFLSPKKDRDRVTRQIFLTLVKDQSVLVLNGAETSSVSAEDVRKFLIQTAESLVIREKPITQNEAKELALKMN